MIRPLTAPKDQEQKSTFIIGEMEAPENIDMLKTEINLPAEPRSVEDCLSIMKNPDVIADPYIVICNGQIIFVSDHPVGGLPRLSCDNVLHSCSLCLSFLAY